MKIEGYLSNKFLIGDLEIGECFSLHNDLCMKINGDYIDTSDGFVAVINLEKNRVGIVHQSEKVEKVNAKIVIE